MPQTHPLSSDARNSFEDFSGVNSANFSNSYDALIDACQNDPKQIQLRYSTHRTARNAKQKETLLAPDFKGLNLDSILQRLEDPTIEPGFVDPRHSIVLWARPPSPIRDLVSQIQQKLRKLAPNLWLMPLPNLHMTALEITHSVTEPETATLLTKLHPQVPTMTDLPYHHRPRLIKPLLSFDSAALALSFLPAAGEGRDGVEDGAKAGDEGGSGSSANDNDDDKYTYHHLRRALYALSHSAGIAIESRYVVPSAHITIARFVTQHDHDSREKMERWVEEIERINEWLEGEVWLREGPRGTSEGERAEGAGEGGDYGGVRNAGEWIVGQGKGLDLRKGVLWYGGGETVRLGKGF